MDDEVFGEPIDRTMEAHEALVVARELLLACASDDPVARDDEFVRRVLDEAGPFGNVHNGAALRVLRQMVDLVLYLADQLAVDHATVDDVVTNAVIDLHMRIVDSPPPT
jgi:hypothetical protein